METRADPEARREAEKEAEKERRRRERRERQEEAEREEWARKQEEMRRERREENGADGAESARKAHASSGSSRGGTGGEHEAAAGRRWTRANMASQRARSWAEYDAAFEAFQSQVLRTRTFAVSQVPLPPAGHAPVAPSATPELWHENVRKALLRWHPDKWARREAMLGDDEAEKEALKQLTQAMFRAVSRHKDAGFRHARAMASAGA